MKVIVKRRRYPNIKVLACPYCQLNPSVGITDSGLLGCQFCQGKVDAAIAREFKVVEE